MITLLPLCVLIFSTAVEIAFTHEDFSVGLNPTSVVLNGYRNRDTAHDRFKCPTNYGRFPHPKECDRYYECKNGWPTLRKCWNNQWYDEDKHQCRDKRNVHCHKYGQDPDDHNEKPKDNFKCPYIWGTFPHPVDCSKYYVCIYSVPALFACDGTDLFHDKAKKCLDRKKVQCGKRLDRDDMRTSRKPSTYQTSTILPSTSLFSTTTSHRHFHCPFQYGRYPDPEDCSRYFECAYFIPRHHRCPRSMLYDERKEECRQDNQVRCGNRPGGITEKPDEVDEEDFKCPYVWGTFPHPKDCSKYIICIYNVPTLFNCRRNELFDASHRKCQPKNKVDCDYRINPKDLTRPPRTTRTRPTRTTRTTRPIRTTNRFWTTRTTSRFWTTRTPHTHSTTTTRIFSTTPVTPEITTWKTTTGTRCNTSPETAITTLKTSVVTTGVPTTTRLPTSTMRPTTTGLPTTTRRLITTDLPITTRRFTTTDLPTTTRRFTPTDLPSTTRRFTTTDLPSTTRRFTTTDLPSTTRHFTTTDLPSTTRRFTTTDLPSTTRRFTTTDLPTTTKLFTTTESTTMTVTKPNTPPPTDCDEDDIECIIDETGDVKGWFDCPERYGHFPHGSNPQLFIHCDNWTPFLKTCADGTAFSPKFLVCMWVDKTKGIVGK